MSAPTSEQLETFCRQTCFDLDVPGVLLAIFYEDRVEIVGGFRKGERDIVSSLRELADEIESGSGLPVGDHGVDYKNREGDKL